MTYYVIALRVRGAHSERYLARKGSDPIDTERRFIPKASFEGYNQYWEVITFEDPDEAIRLINTINAAMDSIHKEAVLAEYEQVPEVA